MPRSRSTISAPRSRLPVRWPRSPQWVASKVGSKILLAGVVVAMFDTGLSANLGYARIYFASGRDRMWPPPVSGALASTNRNQVPKWAFAFLGIACAVFCYLTGLTSLITFTSVMIVTIYLLIATAAIISRLRERDAERSFRMLRYQKFGDIIITLITIAIAVIYWLAYLNPHTKRGPNPESNQP